MDCKFRPFHLTANLRSVSGCLGRWRTIVGAVQKGEISGIWQVLAGRKETCTLEFELTGPLWYEFG
jgi:hypothetical protein